MPALFHNSARSLPSSDDESSSPYRLILDHILTYPDNYEIPLRTMYVLNCAPRMQSVSPHATPASSADNSPVLPSGSFADSPATQSFAESLMAQMSQLPNQPASLPPSFIAIFVHKCFPEDVAYVDFQRALTALDYLKDFEARRRREIAAAMERLGIDCDALRNNADGLAARYPGVVQWIKSLEKKERKVENLYTSMWIGVRRWILINELSLLPFNKHNCVAMLNTLYPPHFANLPTKKLTAEILRSQREGFFKYIQSVESRGTGVLAPLKQQGTEADETNGWPAVARTLHMYIQVADHMINECEIIGNLDDVSPSADRGSKGSGHSRKADSVFSTGGTSLRRPSTKDSNQEPVAPAAEIIRPKTPSGGRPGTALERLARGVRRIGRSKTEATEMIQDDSNATAPAVQKPKGLRKIRSLSSLVGRDSNRASFPNEQPPDLPAFNLEKLRQERMKLGASAGAQDDGQIGAAN